MTIGTVRGPPNLPTLVRMAPPLRWMASVLYLAVLSTGLYYAVAGLSSGWSPVWFTAALVALLALEQIRPTGRGVVLLLARIVLIEVVVAFDDAGFARPLYVLVPFFAYFSLGRRWSIGLAAGYLAAGTIRASFTPGWATDPEIVSDLLMLFVGMVLTIATAAVADRQRRSRVRAERLFAELHQAQQQVAELSATAERNRLARDIHDSLGHHLTAISVQLEKAEAFRERDATVADRAVSDARSATGRALSEVRESVSTLRADHFSLARAVAVLADGLDDPGFSVSVELTGTEGGQRRDDLETLYRVAQEALTNARRHARADVVYVSVRFGEVRVELEVEDNGRGFVPELATGNGLAGMRERLASVGGALHIESEPGRGTRVTARVGD